MSEKPPGSPEQPPAPVPAHEQVAVSFESVRDALKALKAAGVEDPEYTDDPRAEEFQEQLAQLDESGDALSGQDVQDFWLRRSMLFVEAGYTEPERIGEAMEFLANDLGNAEDAGQQDRAATIRNLIAELEKMLPPKAEPEMPTAERIQESLRQPGRIPLEVHQMIYDWKRSRSAEIKGAKSLVDMELEVARMYADSGHPLDAIGSLTSAIMSNKKLEPELKKMLEDYREELKRQ